MNFTYIQHLKYSIQSDRSIETVQCTMEKCLVIVKCLTLGTFLSLGPERQ